MIEDFVLLSPFYLFGYFLQMKRVRRHQNGPGRRWGSMHEQVRHLVDETKKLVSSRPDKK